MATITNPDKRNIGLPAGHVLTVTADAVSSGKVWRQSNSVGRDVAAGTSEVFGPYPEPDSFQLVPAAGSFTYASELVDLTDSDSYGAALANFGYALIKKATVTLTDAQIKALPTTPVQIVAAPGADKVAVVQACLLSVNTMGGAYTNFASGVMTCVMGGSNVVDNVSSDTLLDSEQEIVWHLPAQEWGAEAANAINQSIQLSGSDVAGDFTGGDPANTLTVTVFYTIVDV